MSYTVRPARLDDQTAIAAFTRETFSWGDYVADVFADWVDDADGHVVVAADSNDVAVAVSRVAMLTPQEAWMQGARVREDFRRQGIAGAMANALLGWAGDHGARIARLAIEEWNEPARGQVERDGFSLRSSWVAAMRPIGDASPVPSGNGGRRVSALEQLGRTHSSDAEAAYMAWSGGELSRAGRGLFAVRWRWRRLTRDDLVNAAKAEAFWSARSGWAVASRDDDELEVAWVETRPDDALDLMRGLVDLAATEGAVHLKVMLPAVDWLTQAARRAGCTLDGLDVYERPL